MKYLVMRLQFQYIAGLPSYQLLAKSWKFPYFLRDSVPRAKQ